MLDALIAAFKNRKASSSNYGVSDADLSKVYALGSKGITLSSEDSIKDVKLLDSLYVDVGISTPNPENEVTTMQKLNNRRVSDSSYGYEKRFLSDPEFKLANGIDESNIATAEALMANLNSTA